MSKYNKQIAYAVRQVMKPFPALTTTVLEFPDFLQVCVYENQIMELSDERRAEVMQYLLLVRDVIESFNVRCELGGLKGDPPR